LVTGSYDRSLKLWDAATGKVLSEWKDVHKGHLRTVAFSPDGKRLVTAGADNRVVVWDIETREPVKELEGYKVTPMSACFSPDGRRLAVGCGDPAYKVKTGSVHVYDAETWEERKGADWAEHQANGVAFSPDGKTLAVGGSGGNSLALYDPDTGKRVRPVPGAHSVRCVAWSADGKWLAAAHGNGGKHGNGSVVVFDAATGAEEAVLAGHSSLVLGMGFGPDGRLGTASNDGTFKTWGPVRPATAPLAKR
ncbi:MAG: WD40 repeat domain-containing protein, partial [Gemmataceae bacterium]